MNDLPIWPPLLMLVLGMIGYVVFWLWSRRLDRLDEQERRDAAE